jgi:hypothetical protein
MTSKTSDPLGELTQRQRSLCLVADLAAWHAIVREIAAIIVYAVDAVADERAIATVKDLAGLRFDAAVVARTL